MYGGSLLKSSCTIEVLALNLLLETSHKFVENQNNHETHFTLHAIH